MYIAASRMRFHRPIPGSVQRHRRSMRIVNTLLQLMEEYDAPGLLVATTNVESSLDEAPSAASTTFFRFPCPAPWRSTNCSE